MRFDAYEKLKHYLSKRSKRDYRAHGDKKQTTNLNVYFYFAVAEPSDVWQLVLCSSMAGALGGACGNPGDIVNIRMQKHGQLLQHRRRSVTNMQWMA